MASRNKRKPSRSRSNSSSAYDLELELARMLGQKVGFPMGRSLPNSSPPKPTNRSISAPPSTNLIGAWLNTLYLLETMLPDTCSHDSIKPDYVFAVENVYRDSLTFKCKHLGNQYQLFIARGSSIPAGCSCSVSDGERPCEHIGQMVVWLERELTRNQALIRKIVLKDFACGSHDPKSFKADQSELFRRQIRSAIEPLKSFASNQPASSLPDPFDLTLNQPPTSRIVWNFKLIENRLSVETVLQNPKKRGGWNKGKAIPLYEVLLMQDRLADRDREILSKVYSQNYAYYPKDLFKLDPLEVLEKCVGCDRVSMNGEPAQVVRGEPSLELYAGSPQTIGFRFNAGRTSAMTESGHCTWWDPDSSTIYYSPLNSDQRRIVQQLLKIDQVPSALRRELEDVCQQYQHMLTFNFAKHLDCRAETELFQPVLMLMLDESYRLHFAKRIKLLRTGELKLPGDGPAQRYVTEKDEPSPKLYVRDSLNEQQLWSGLDQRLRLPNGDQGCITELGNSLELFERMQALQNDSEKLQGLEILWDDRSQTPLTLLGSVTPQNLRVTVGKSRDWFQLQGECDFNGKSFELATLLKCLKDVDASSMHGDYVKLGDHGWAKISAELRKRLVSLHHSLNEDRKKLVFDATSAREVAELANDQIQVGGIKEWTQCLDRIERARTIEPVLPSNLRAELRDYQKEGFAWMRRLAEWGVGGLLADDMGLGKTLQTLAVLLDRSAGGAALVVAPTSVGFNWVREAEKFAPDLKVSLYRETDRGDFLTTVGAGDLVVCSYGLVLRDAEKLAQVKWNTLVLDEAQAIKNARSKTASAIQAIPAEWTVALTGTPVENHLGELWSLFHSISPGVLGGWEQFRKRYAVAIERNNCAEAGQQLRDRIRPFILRRTKKEVLKDLPPRTETNLYVDLSPAERERYNRVRLSAIGEIDEIAQLNDVKDQRFRILALMTRLRQLACSPRMIDQEWKERSSKLELLVTTLQELREEGHKCLVFSQFVKHLDLIREALTEEGISFEYLDGSTPAAERQNRVDQFQSGASDVFLISLKAGGTGLNLTAADYVIHMDPWWNPAVEDQATDRAHRIGQDKPVMVYRLISSNTIEDEILKLHDTKRDLVAGVLDGSQAAGKMSTDDLIRMIRG